MFFVKITHFKKLKLMNFKKYFKKMIRFFIEIFLRDTKKKIIWENKLDVISKIF